MSAPSFSSFPSFASFPESVPGPSKRRSPSPPRSRRKDEKRKDGTRDKTRKDKHKDDKEKHKRDKRDKHHSDRIIPILVDDERLKAEEDRKRKDEKPPVFYSDRKGDRLNVTYGGLHAGDVPKYRLVGGGRKILGLNRAWTAVHRSNKGVEVAVGGRRRLPTLTDSSSRALLAAPPTRSFITSERKYKYEEIDGFLRLPSRRGRQDDQAYREIGLTKNDSDSESSDASEDGSSSDSDSDSPPLTSHQQTLKSLEQHLTSDPTSVPTWLSLLAQTLSSIPPTSKNAIKAHSEIALSILSRALSVHPTNRTSKELRLRYLKAGEEVWHESKLRSEWEDALKLGPGAIDIWMEWLEWRIRKGLDGVNGVVEDAGRVLKSLSDGEAAEMGKLRVVWRTAVALQNAGYTERATALFQAQAELTFEVPQSLYGLPLRTLLNALEEFWESETPRVGEPGAKGWSAWVSSGRPDHSPNLSTKAAIVPDTPSTDPYTKWWKEEADADRKLKFPTRSTDNDGEADPYGTILFSDNRPLLLHLQTERAKNAFRLIWLSLLGLHVPGLSASLSIEPRGSWDDRWSSTHLTSPTYLSSIFPGGSQTRINSESQAGVLIGREKEYASGFGPVKNWSLGVLRPIERIGKGNYGLWTKEEMSGVDEGFVRRVFEQLKWGSEDIEWDCYALAFEAALNVKSALKLSRLFLSNAQESLLHWAAHAGLERFRGRTEEARKIFQAVLVSSPPSPSRPGTSQLWWDWSEMEWLAGETDAALRVILGSVGVGGTSGVMVLRAKRSLEEKYKASAQMSWKEREFWVKLRGLLELLTSSASAALLTFDEYLLNDSDFIEGTPAHESLLVSSLLVLYHNGTTLRNPTPPSLLRDRLSKAIEDYPSNTLILGMFLEAEKGQGVWGRVRTLLGEDNTRIGREKDIGRRVAEVWIAAGWEKGRWETEKERIRSGLVAAIENERTRGSPIIRRMFLEFEIRTGELQRAKKMLYGAIGDCPLSKELYLLAFGPLRSVFSPQELNSFADTMAERDLRMRKGLDEVLEGWEGNRGTTSDDSGESADELEYNARELRRLMPY